MILLIFMGLMIYGGGWYATSLGLAGYRIRSESKPKPGCQSLRHHAVYEDKQDCLAVHGRGCWRDDSPIELTPYQKRKLVTESMKMGTVWPIAAVALAIGGPAVLLYLAVLRPLALGAHKVGQGIVAGSVFMAEKSVDVAMSTASRFEVTDHKNQLEAPKTAAEKKAEQIEEEITDLDAIIQETPEESDVARQLRERREMLAKLRANPDHAVEGKVTTRRPRKNLAAEFGS